jgi:hypothetical protein
MHDAAHPQLKEVSHKVKTRRERGPGPKDKTLRRLYHGFGGDANGPNGAGPDSPG